MINQIRASVEAEFAQVNALIIEQLHSDVDMVENVGQYIVDAGGKRLRPLLALLAAASLGNVTEKAHQVCSGHRVHSHGDTVTRRRGRHLDTTTRSPHS